MVIREYWIVVDNGVFARPMVAAWTETREAALRWIMEHGRIGYYIKEVEINERPSLLSD
jgi:hypothetical protein